MAGKLEMNNHSAHENTLSPETYTLTIPYITISGRSGTGKSATAEALANVFGILPENNIKTGVLFRQALEKRGVVVEGFASREKELDAALDKEQARLMRTATIEKPRIIEGRLAGVINKEIKQEAEEQQKPIPRGISLLFICEKEVREARQVDRDTKLGKNPSDVIQKNFERDTGDFEFWQDMHKTLLARKTIEDLYDAEVDEKGNLTNELYDMVIDTTYSSVEEIVKSILIKFSHKGCIQGGEILFT